MVALFLVMAMLLGPVVQERMIDRAAFMKGCWIRTSGNRVVEEQWMGPRAGNMVGMGRTTRGDTLLEYEHVRIYERNGKLVYAAQPSGQRPAEFESLTIEQGAITFANPAHDFPQRVIYRAGGDSLFARVEGTMNGRERGVDFRYARARCD